MWWSGRARVRGSGARKAQKQIQSGDAVFFFFFFFFV